MDPAGANRHMGLQLLKRGNFEEGLKYLIDARNMYASVDNGSMAAKVDMDIASVMFELGRFDEFVKFTNSAKDYFDAEGVTEIVGGIMLTSISKLSNIEGYEEEVLERVSVAKPIFEKMKDAGFPIPAPYPLILADLEFNAALALHNLAKWEEALPHFEKACEMFEKTDPINLNVYEEYYARALMSLGRFEEAVKHLEKVKELTEKRGDLKKVAQIDQELGECYNGMRDYNQAIKCFDREMQFHKMFGQEYNILIAEHNIFKAKRKMERGVKKHFTEEEKEQLKEAYKLTTTGNFLKDKDRFAEAVETWKIASKMHEGLGDIEFASEIKTNIGLLLIQMGKIEEAFEQFSEARKILEELGLKMEQAMLENIIGHQLRDFGLTKDAVDYLEKSRFIFQGLKKMKEVANVDKEMSLMLYEIGLIDEAISKRRDAISVYEKLKDELEVAHNEEMMAFLLFKAQRPKEALEHISNANKIYKKLGKKDKTMVSEEIERRIRMNIASREEIKEKYKNVLLPEELEELLRKTIIPHESHGIDFKAIYEEVINNLTRFEEVFGHIRPKSGFAYKGVDPVAMIFDTCIGIAKSDERFSENLKYLEILKNAHEKAGRHFKGGGVRMDADIAAIDRDMKELEEAEKLQVYVHPFMEEVNRMAKAAKEEYETGITLLKQKKSEEALKHLEAARGFFEKGRQEIELGEINLAIVLSLGELGRVDEARRRLKESKHMIVMLGRIADVVIFEKYIGGLLLKLNRFKEAIKQLEAVKTFFEKTGKRQQLNEVEMGIKAAKMKLEKTSNGQMDEPKLI